MAEDNPFIFILPPDEPVLCLSNPFMENVVKLTMNFEKYHKPVNEIERELFNFEQYHKSINEIETELFDLGLEIPSRPQYFENFLKLNLHLFDNYNIPESHHINIDTSIWYRHSREIELIKQQIHYPSKVCHDVLSYSGIYDLD